MVQVRFSIYYFVKFSKCRFIFQFLHRITGQAGTKIPEHPVDSEHCHTHTTGWLNGEHPTVVGETVVREVCFNLFGDSCWRHTEIQVKHCGGFFLYYLGTTPGCNLRYCTTQ